MLHRAAVAPGDPGQERFFRENHDMIDFRCKHCRHSTRLLASICLHCGTSRPAARGWHVPALIVLLAPLVYGLLLSLLR